MPKSPSPEVRLLLIERAAAMLARRESITLRSLVAGTGVSTMAVYTYFKGMDGLWGAVREEGFRRLAGQMSEVQVDSDPVRYLAALGVAYVDNARTRPDLYRVMFDASFELPDPQVADVPFGKLVDAVSRAISAGRFDSDATAGDIALRFWANGHGIVSLAVTGVLPHAELRRHAPAMTAALFVDAGDTPARARRSVDLAWHAAQSWT